MRRQLTRHCPARLMRAVRCVETPPGLHAQHGWFDVVRIGGTRRLLHGLIGTLSHSRALIVWLSSVMDQLARQTAHFTQVDHAISVQGDHRFRSTAISQFG